MGLATKLWKLLQWSNFAPSHSNDTAVVPCKCCCLYNLLPNIVTQFPKLTFPIIILPQPQKLYHNGDTIPNHHYMCVYQILCESYNSWSLPSSSNVIKLFMMSVYDVSPQLYQHPMQYMYSATLLLHAREGNKSILANVQCKVSIWDPYSWEKAGPSVIRSLPCLCSLSFVLFESSRPQTHWNLCV